MRTEFRPQLPAPYIGGMEKGNEFRLYPKRWQEELLARNFGCVRWAYNRFLEEKIRVYKETGKSLSYCECSKMLTRLKTQ